MDKNSLKELKGFLIFNDKFRKAPVSIGGNLMIDNYWRISYIDNSLHKFANDEIDYKNDLGWFFLDGHVDNKSELIKRWKILPNEWAKSCVDKGVFSDPSELRGGFCGVRVIENEWSIFSDHVGNRAVYYYCENGYVAVSNRIPFLIELLHENGLKTELSEQACRYMLQQGFMLDETTFVSGIFRVLPGQLVMIDVNGSVVEKVVYYQLDNTNIDSGMSEPEAIDIIDQYFRQAIKREYDKDIEYGYRHLVDLSGGLDSRMTCWVAHDMGYLDQLNLTMSRYGYWDMRIAAKIAVGLNHEFMFAGLDDFGFFFDWTDNIVQNNGAATYSGSSDVLRMLRHLKLDGYGVNHTGMVGDSIIGVFFDDEETTYSVPTGREKSSSMLLDYPVSDDVLRRFLNCEQFAVYTRGLLGAQSSYIKMQNFLETASPFLDVDFLDAVFKIPHRLRRKHHIYLEWIRVKYPRASDFGWEKWHGIRPKESNRWQKRISTTLHKGVRKVIRDRVCAHGMIPMDYWYYSHEDVCKKTESYFFDGIDILDGLKNIKDDAIKMFIQGNVEEKTQAISVIEMARCLK